MPTSIGGCAQRALPGLIIALHSLGAFGCTSTHPAEWWFSTQVPAGGELRYRVLHELHHLSDNADQRDQRDVVVIVERAEDSREMRWRLAGEWSEYPANTTLGVALIWLRFLQERHGHGIVVSPTEIRSGQTPVLRGPWRSGDRLTFAGLFGTAHVEVVSADARTIQLKFDFFVGYGRVLWGGAGTIRMVNDSDRLREADAQWYWAAGDKRCDATLTIRRLD